MFNVYSLENNELLNTFESYEEAKKYGEEKKIFIEEKPSKIKKGLWLFIYSNKNRKYNPYGIIQQINNIFVILKTKKNQTEKDFCFLRIIKVEDMLKNKKFKLMEYGNFID